VKQRVVRAEAVGRDAQVADARIVGQDDGKWRRSVAGPRALVEQMGDRGGVDGAAGQRGGQGGLQRAGPVLIEEA